MSKKNRSYVSVVSPLAFVFNRQSNDAETIAELRANLKELKAENRRLLAAMPDPPFFMQPEPEVPPVEPIVGSQDAS